MVDYPPEVNIQFLKTNNKWISGVGKEAIPQIAPAIAQAVFKITVKRIRSLPGMTIPKSRSCRRWHKIIADSPASP